MCCYQLSVIYRAVKQLKGYVEPASCKEVRKGRKTNHLVTFKAFCLIAGYITTHMSLGKTKLLAKSNVNGMEKFSTPVRGVGSILTDVKGIYYSLHVFYEFLIRFIINS